MTRQPRVPNMQQALTQLQKLQQAMALAQEELKHEVVEGSAGGGAVKASVTGALEVRSITIEPAAVDPEEVELLADMVLAAVNDALSKAQELAASRLGGAGQGLDLNALGGLGLPGL